MTDPLDEIVSSTGGTTRLSDALSEGLRPGLAIAEDERRLKPAYEKSTEPRRGDHPLLKFFRYEHLPQALREVSKPFGILATEVCRLTPAGAEQTVALRKLLEAKDAAVRARLEPTL